MNDREWQDRQEEISGWEEQQADAKEGVELLMKIAIAVRDHYSTSHSAITDAYDEWIEYAEGGADGE